MSSGSFKFFKTSLYFNQNILHRLLVIFPILEPCEIFYVCTSFFCKTKTCLNLVQRRFLAVHCGIYVRCFQVNVQKSYQSSFDFQKAFTILAISEKKRQIIVRSAKNFIT